jgi:FkbM family methyltransferase
MLEARLRERLCLEAPAERLFEANVEKNLAAIPIVDRVDHLLRMHGESSISLGSLDQPSLCEALDKAEEMILGLRDGNAGRDPVRSIPLRAVTPAETGCALESGKSNAPTKPATRRLARIKQSAEVLRKHGLLKFLELSTLSLIEPVKSAQLRAAVAADANRILIKIKGGGGRGLFIDCGSNIGQGYRFFSKFYPPDLYDYILVEPNTNCVPHLHALRRNGNSSIEIIEKAASVRDGHTKLFGPPVAQRDPTYEGCSIVVDHNNALYEAEEITVGLVETFSLSDLIMAKRAAYDVVVMKMDVEGAEYEILEDMIEKGAHRELVAIYVEFHSQYMTGSERTDRRFLEKKIQNSFSAENIVFRRWI